MNPSKRLSAFASCHIHGCLSKSAIPRRASAILRGRLVTDACISGGPSACSRHRHGSWRSVATKMGGMKKRGTPRKVPKDQAYLPPDAAAQKRLRKSRDPPATPQTPSKEEGLMMNETWMGLKPAVWFLVVGPMIAWSAVVALNEDLRYQLFRVMGKVKGQDMEPKPEPMAPQYLADGREG